MKYFFVVSIFLLVFSNSLTLGQTQNQDVESEQSRIDPQQNFYPSFSPFQNQPLGHSRPLHQQEGAYSHRPQSPYQQQVGYEAPSARYSGFKGDFQRQDQQQENAPTEHGLLGSGNFGVIRGGTFYNDNENENNYEGDYNSYFRNGHGRPSFYFGGPSNPRPYQHEQFANFRDFADINTPSDRQYSQYVVVYVNKNGTKAKIESERPKNIIESLALLDLESGTTTEVPQKKLSKSKRKLAKIQPEKKTYKFKKSLLKKFNGDLQEPMLALS